MEEFGERLIATTLFGLEQVLYNEMIELGARNASMIKRGVTFDFTEEMLYKANLSARTALRILAPVFVFEAESPEELYIKARALDWGKFMNVRNYFSINGAVNSKAFPHQQYANLKLKDAICDYFRDKTGKRPNISTEKPDIVWHLHVFEDKVTISLDSSGESLHIRGTRASGHAAPLNEVLAAGAIALSGWDKQTPFFDGMCGTGTLLTEAAMMATGKAPNLHRRFFPFMRWPSFNKTVFEGIRTALMQLNRDKGPIIRGCDIAPITVRRTRMSLENAEMNGIIQVNVADFFDMEAPAPKGTLIINPPYGERMQEEDIEGFYKKIGDTFKQKFKGWRCGILSSNPEALKRVGLRSQLTFHLMNGKLPCQLKFYDMYEGGKGDQPATETK